MSPTSATVSGAVVASDSESSTSRQRRNIRRALGGRAARPSSVDGAGPPLSPILSSGATSLDTLTRFRSKSSLERASDKKETSAPDVLAPSAHSVLIHVHLADVDGQKLAAASQTGGTATDAHLDAADIGSLAGTTASTAGETVAGFMMPSPASPVADDAASHAGSGHSNATDHSDASTKDKRKPTYFQKLGIAFRAVSIHLKPISPEAYPYTPSLA
ncbi:hypothetical protein BC830DRAFT_827802 [Chytriomyces sp. MP71]|nr:hypothetical protein BC830DRAFT_827802 [Chytriomyces sp. MP71]